MQSGAACGRWWESRTSSPDADEEDVGLDTARTEVVFHGQASGVLVELRIKGVTGGDERWRNADLGRVIAN